MPSKFLIYGLVDPRDGQLRYVGLHEGDVKKRLREHLCHARKGKKIYVYDWIRSVLATGKSPEIVTLEACESVDEMVEAECWHVAYWLSLGCRLTNLTAGGEGCFGYKHTEEAKKKMRVPKGPWTLERKRSRSPLTAEQDGTIVSMYVDGGQSCECIGKVIGVSGGCIRKVLLRNEVRIRTSFEPNKSRMVVRSANATLKANNDN